MNITVREIDPLEAKIELLHRPQAVAGRILKKVRRAAKDIGYAGDVAPELAWALFSTDAAELVDVRTKEELAMAGSVPFAKHVEWQTGRNRQHNLNFIDELNAVVGRKDVVLFLCASGVRSVAAAKAAMQAGYQNAFNVLEGFEGDGSPERGWANRRLPIQD